MPAVFPGQRAGQVLVDVGEARAWNVRLGVSLGAESKITTPGSLMCFARSAAEMSVVYSIGWPLVIGLSVTAILSDAGAGRKNKSPGVPGLRGRDADQR
jgi:hypothetical protein